MRVFIHLPHGLNRENYREEYLAGVQPEESPYGFHRAEEVPGLQVEFSKDFRETQLSTTLRKVCRKVFGFDVLHAFYNRNEIETADIVWTVSEGEALAVALMKTLHLVVRPKIIANAVWLLDRWPLIPFYHRSLFKALVKQFNVLTVHSSSCIAVATSIFPKLDVRLLCFGINAEVFKFSGLREWSGSAPLRVFSPGNDRTRDFDVLISSLAGNPQYDITIFCSWFDPNISKNYSNVQVISDRRLARLIEEYRKCDVVVICLKSNLYSGITVALEAAAMGKPLVCSETGGVPTYFNEGEVTYVPVSDVSALKEAVLTAAMNKEKAKAAQQRFIRSGYSTQGFIERYVSLSIELLQSPSI